MSDDAPVLFESAGGIARITLNRPDKLNSFNVAMHEALQATLDRVEGDASIRVLLITGAGRAFCAGQDLGDPSVNAGEGRVDLGESVRKYYIPLILRLRKLPFPVVCAVNGTAAGAGANLAFACDVVLATHSAKFVEPYCKLGLVPDAGGTWFLTQTLGTARALGLALTGEKFSAEDAARWGLIWKCVEDDSFASTVDNLVQRIAAAPTKGMARTKQAIYAATGNALDAQLALEADYMRELGFSADYAEGVAAFLEKRNPTFTGK